MSRILSLLIVIIYIYSHAAIVTAQSRETTISDIRITGNKRVNGSLILSRINSRKNSLFSQTVLDDDLKKILNLYSDKLFFLSTIDSVTKQYSSDSLRVSIGIYVTENKKIVIDSLTFSGMSAFSSEWLINRTELSSGREFDPAILSRDIQSILNGLENEGYPFAVVRVSRFSVISKNASPAATVTIHVTEGPLVTLNKAEFTGQKQTRTDILFRTSGIRFPAPYRQKDIDNSVMRLKKLPFIESVTEPDIVRFNDSLFGLRYEIAEGLSNRFDGIAGYVPKGTSAGERGYFTGMISISFMNLFGTARKLDAFWQKKNRFSQEFQLGYTEPWVLNYSVEAGVFIQQIVQDTTYVLREYGLNTKTEIFTNAVALAGIKRKSIDPSGPVNSYIFNIPYSVFLTGFLGFEWDSRDDRMNPRSGAYYLATVDYTRQTERSYVESPGIGDTLWIGDVPRTVRLQKKYFSTQKIGMTAEWYLPVHRRWVIYEALHGLYYKTPRSVVPYSEQFLLGGIRTVRGFLQDQFNGSRVAWNNFELRWITSRDSRLFLFFDAGYYFRNEYTDAGRTNIRKVSGFPAGYGFGIRYMTKIGMFGMDYGLGTKDSFSEGKIHFGITSRF